MTFSKDIKTIVLPVLDRYGCDLVLGTFHRESVGLVLRLLVEQRGAHADKGSGMDLRLCSSISRDLSAALDVEDVIDKPYTLEVSSPGIERPLVKPEDFERFAGRLIILKTSRAINGKRRFKGVLKGLNNGVVTVTTNNGEAVPIPGEFVKKANLVFDPNGSNANVGD
ncbi:MAG: ribosome maturation factor RimP [Deltaproteobacteria bacterium]|nr:ribosome maturation factor RimP [Deltaproteobacteria bacterium]